MLIQFKTYKFHISQEKVSNQNPQELANQIMLRPGHSGISSALLIVFGPFI
jgi:hypothetical protein